MESESSINTKSATTKLHLKQADTTDVHIPMWGAGPLVELGDPPNLYCGLQDDQRRRFAFQRPQHKDPTE